MNDEPAPSAVLGGARKKWLLLAGAAFGLAGLAWIFWPDSKIKSGTPPPAEVVDPRLTFPTPYRNVRPDVQFVGDKVCAGCHKNIAETYAHHPMGQSLAPVANATTIEQYDAKASNPFTALGLHYGVERRDERVVHREWAEAPKGNAVVQFEAEAQFAVGSGTRARSYFVNRDGYLFESPVSWYSQGNRWDLSPSYELRNRHFSRAVTPPCLFCHCNFATHVPFTLNRYREPIFQGYAIGCERCHGPGELHVRLRESGEAVQGRDFTIVNPKKLSYSLREDVCHQCHVQSEQRVVCRGRSDFDYRPGLPLHLFLMDFVDKKDRGADVKFVSSVEQLKSSRCYQESTGKDKLGCISCHDPHRNPAIAAEKSAHYRERCLRCHTEQSCSLPVAARREKVAGDSCIACHMPPTGSEVNHTSITDHRIARRPGPRAAKGETRRPTPGPDDLVPFHRDPIEPEDPEAERNLGFAQMSMLDRGLPDAVAQRFASRALPLLEKAVARDPRDLPARVEQANALWCLGRRDEATTVYESTLAAGPAHENALLGAGNLALTLNRLDAARSYFEQAVQLNPYRWQLYHGLGVVSFRRGEWERALRECEKALRLDPTNTGTRSLLVQCHLASGQPKLAQREFETIQALTPEARRPALTAWFQEQQRRLERK